MIPGTLVKLAFFSGPGQPLWCTTILDDSDNAGTMTERDLALVIATCRGDEIAPRGMGFAAAYSLLIVRDCIGWVECSRLVTVVCP